MSIVDTPHSAHLADVRQQRDWRTWNLIVLALLSAYSVALGWQAQFVAYPLYRDVPAAAFGAYHEAYNRAIPLVVIVPGFLTFIAGAAFYWTRPAALSKRLGAIISAASVVALAVTVLWAIPKHDELDRIGGSDATIDSLLRANLIRSIALTVATVALAWGLRRRSSRGTPMAR